MIIRCCFPCLHISDLQMKIHDRRETDFRLRTYMIELWISAVECWISIVYHGYPLSFAFGFPCIPIYWLCQVCYLFITWSKWFACVKSKKLPFIYSHGMEHWYSTLLCIKKSSRKKYFECLAQLIALSDAIYLDRFEFGYRSFQYWSDSENRNSEKYGS